jgi:hypothetical protein
MSACRYLTHGKGYHVADDKRLRKCVERKQQREEQTEVLLEVVEHCVTKRVGDRRRHERVFTSDHLAALDIRLS